MGDISAILLLPGGYDALNRRMNGRGERMEMVRRAVPVAVSVAVVCLVTAILWSLKRAGDGLLHPVFFYLFPIALLAILYGSLPALLCASTATLCAAFFLYDPLYSLRVTNHLEVGDLVFFVVLALIGVKCTAELLRPPANVPDARSRYGRS
jgi:K+-sensing histidine kinase KdpD